MSTTVMNLVNTVGHQIMAAAKQAIAKNKPLVSTPRPKLCTSANIYVEPDDLIEEQEEATSHVTIRSEPSSFNLQKPGYSLRPSTDAVVAQADIRLSYSEGSDVLTYTVYSHFTHLEETWIIPCCNGPKRKWCWVWAKQYQAFFDPSKNYADIMSEADMLAYHNKSYAKKVQPITIDMRDPGFIDNITNLTNLVVMMVNQHVDTVSTEAERIRNKMIAENISVKRCQDCLN